NTSPLNAAVINSVGAHIRATAIAVNIFIIHILGDVPSPTMMGWVADRHSLQAAFVLPVIAMVVSSVILFYGMRFAPPLRVECETASPPPPGASSSQNALANPLLDRGRHPRHCVVLAHCGSGARHADHRRYRAPRVGSQPSGHHGR